MLNWLLRRLLRLHLRRPRAVATGLLLLSLTACWGALRVERKLDLLSLLPRDQPVVRNSLRAGVGSQELMVLAAEGTAADLAERRRWLEGLAERLCPEDLPFNGLGPDGRLIQARPVPDAHGAALWPPLLAAGALAAGDRSTLEALGVQAYNLAPLVLGERLEPLLEPAAAHRALARSVADLGGLDPVQARLAVLDPLRLREAGGIPELLAQGRTRLPHGFKFGGATLQSGDGAWVLLPLVLRFPTGDVGRTTALVAWLAGGAQGPLPARGSLGAMAAALAPSPDRPFRLQVAGGHAVTAWEAGQLGREIGWSLLVSFLLIGLVYAAGFRTLAGFGCIAGPLLMGMLWALGGLGLALGRLNLMVALFAAVLLGVGDDAGILLLCRYQDARRAGLGRALALKAALLGTGPGVLAGGLTFCCAFLAFLAVPVPALRELGLTLALAFLACLCATFLGLPALVLFVDRNGALARRPAPAAAARRGRGRPRLALALVLAAGLGARQLTWQQDLAALRRAENPAMALQERLAKLGGNGWQSLALHLDLDDPARLPATWNRAAALLRAEGLPVPPWRPLPADRAERWRSAAWRQDLLDRAQALGADPDLLRPHLLALQDGLAGTAQALAAFQLPGGRSLQIPLVLAPDAQDRVQAGLRGSAAMLVGTRPLAQALKTLAREGLLRASDWCALALALALALFGRRARFVLLAALPPVAGLAGALGALGWTGTPLGFLSLCALPIVMGVSVDLTLNLLHRARRDPGAPARLGRVSAVCAGTTLAGFGSLMVSGHAGLRGLGLAAFAGTALALLTVQWLLPPMLARWPLAIREDQTGR